MLSNARSTVSAAIVMAASVLLTGAAVAGEFASLPATFTGALPCQDCSERRLLLNLRPDGVFHFRDERTFEDVDTTLIKDEIGVWEFTAGGDTLLLHPTLGQSFKLAVGEDQTLTLVNLGHEVLDSAQQLSRIDSYQPIEPRLFLRGKFSIRGDETVFRECVTGKRLIVEESGDYAELDEAYRKQLSRYGRDLLVSLVGRIVREDGEPAQEMLIVEQYGGIWPVEVCGRWITLAELENTSWFLMNLADEAFLAPMSAPEPYLWLDSSSARFEMVDGCNRLSGGYELEGDRIRFGAPEGNTEDCLEQASAYRDAIKETVSWSIQGALLRLYNADGEMLAWFEPRFQKHD
jgi:copper homeostasis protein (lipoprotein)